MPYSGLNSWNSRAVDDPRDHLVHVIGRAHILGDDRVELLGVVMRRARLAQLDPCPRFAAQVRDDVADDGQRMLVILGEMIDHARLARMEVAAAQLLGAEISSPVAAFTSGGPARKMVPWLRTMTLSSLIAGT